MIRIDDVLTMWAQDARIDEILLDESSIDIPRKHAKYLDLLMRSKRQLREQERAKKSFPIADRRGNDEYAAIESSIEESKDLVEALEKCIYHINGMAYNIGNIVKWRQFTNGSPT